MDEFGLVFTITTLFGIGILYNIYDQPSVYGIGKRKIMDWLWFLSIYVDGYLSQSWVYANGNYLLRVLFGHVYRGVLH